jgi:hypothetical protein
MRNEIRVPAILRGILRALLCSLLLLLAGCNVGGKTTTLSLDTNVASIPAATQKVFSASISHNNGQFLGATWALTSNGSACSPGCGTLGKPTNSGSAGNGDTSTIPYNAPPVPPNPNSVTITATSVENTSSSGSDTFTITATVAPLAVQTASLPQGTAGVAYTSTTLQATGGVSPYSWSVPSGSLPTGLSLSAAGLISGMPTAGGTSTFAVQVQDSTGALAGASETIVIAGGSGNACGSPGGSESLLKGQYAFLLEGSDGNGPNAIVGTFTADGAGNITAGQEDVNLNTGSDAFTQSIIPASNSYTVGSDHRGCLALTTSSATYVYRFALGSISSGISGKGRLVEFDTTGTLTAGVMKLQNASAFSTSAISGNYAFGVASPAPGQFAAAGAFTASVGAISAGALDANVAGNVDGTAGNTFPASPLSFTGSYTVDAIGRGTLSLSATSNQINSICYVVSAGELDCISSDAQNANPLFAGTVLQQSGAPFSNASVNGASVRYLSGIASSGSGVKVEIGLVQADGAGTFSQTTDTDDGGTFSSPTASGTYSVAANGRLTIPGVNQAPLFYLVGPNQGFSIGASANVSSGFMEPQSAGPFTNSSLSGTYAFGQFVPSALPGQFQTGESVADGAGNLSGTSDVASTASLLPAQSLAGGVYAISSNGRGTLSWNGSLANVFYVISPTQWVMIDVVPVSPELQIGEQ